MSDVCQVCNGTGVEVIPGKGARPCSCRSGDARQQFVAAANLPARHAQAAFESFQAKTVSQGKALIYSRTLVGDYPYINRGLLLMGPVGVGKTHLAVAILRGLLTKGVPCLFYESGALLKQIQNSYNPVSQTSESRVLAPVYNAEVLALDELGATVPTAWVRDTLYQIINTRYNDKKLTIFTTNFTDAPPPPPNLEERIGVPLRSRLYEMCNKVEMDGPDFRKLEGNENV